MQRCVLPQVTAVVDRRQDRGEFSEHRFHQLKIYTYGAGRPIFVLRHNTMIIGWPASRQLSVHRHLESWRVTDTAVTKEAVPWNPSR